MTMSEEGGKKREGGTEQPTKPEVDSRPTVLK